MKNKTFVFTLIMIMMCSFLVINPTNASACSYDFDDFVSDNFGWYHLSTGTGSVIYTVSNYENYTNSFPPVGPPAQTLTKHEIHIDYKVISFNPATVSVTNKYNSNYPISTDFGSFSGAAECWHIIPGDHSFINGSNTTVYVEGGYQTTLSVTVGTTVHVNLGHFQEVLRIIPTTYNKI